MQILGHRGWPHPSHPENTLASLDAALHAGADGVEVDVRLTADGIAVCCHDDDLHRVGGRLSSVRATRLAQLQAVRLAGGHQVPRLVDVLDLVAGRGQLVLDLKPDPRGGALVRAALAALRLTGADTGQLVVSSFDPLVMDVLAVRSPRLARAAIAQPGAPVQPALAAARRRSDHAVHLPLAAVLTESTAVRAAVSGGLAVRAWTVNRPVDAQLCDALGVTAVISDVPGLLAGRLAAA